MPYIEGRKGDRMEREKRQAPRFEVRAPAEFQNDARGSGMTWNVSVSGVLIEHASALLPIGTQVEVRFSFFPGSFDTTFVCHVVRQTEHGFALVFSGLDEPRRKVLKTALPIEEV